MAASGDNGAGVNWPTAEPAVLAMSGTNLTWSGALRFGGGVVAAKWPSPVKGQYSLQIQVTDSANLSSKAPRTLTIQ